MRGPDDARPFGSASVTNTVYVHAPGVPQNIPPSTAAQHGADPDSISIFIGRKLGGALFGTDRADSSTDR